MTTPCPNCSASALGTDALSICTECASVSVVGASVSIPTMLATAALAVVCAYVAKSAAQALTRRVQLARA